MSVINRTGHGLTAGQRVTFDNLVGGAPIDEEVVYFVLAAGLTADAFQISETEDGTPLTFATLTSADMTVVPETDDTDTFDPVYEPEPPGAVMEPPTTPAAPPAPVLSSINVSGIVRLVVTFSGSPEAPVREYDVAITHKFDSATGLADYDEGIIYTLPQGTTEWSIPALPSTVYAVKVRKQDVYGNFSPYCTEQTITTVDGFDSLASNIAQVANDIPDGIVTEIKIADGAVTAPKIVANAISANHLAATLVLASLIKTAESGRRIEIDIDGIRLLDALDGLLVRIPTNGDPVYVKGEINADSLISQTAAEFRTAASLAGSSVMTLQNGVASPSTAPSLATGLAYLSLTSTPPNLGYGIAYDSGAGTYWIAADPSASDYVAHEYNATTGVLVRSIMATGETETFTDTVGSTSHVADGADGYAASTTDNQFSSPITMPRDGRVTKVSVYAAGRLGTVQLRNAIWSNGGTLLKQSAWYTAADEGATGVGDSHHYDKTLGSPETVNGGSTYRIGFFKADGDSDGVQFDFDSGAGKTLYIGDNGQGDYSGGSTSTSKKINTYLTYEYDVDTRLESSKMVGIATDGTHVYTLDDDAQLWKYLRSDLSFVATADLSAHVTGASAKAGLFYDATANELIVTTMTGTGAGVFPKFVRVTPSTLAVPGSYSAAAGPSFTGSTASIRGGARLNDPLNASAATYWTPINGAAYAYTFSGSTATNTANRDFGTIANCNDGLTYDGSNFRGWAIATPTKVYKFTNWDWTTASAIYWVGYAWYDSAGTTHETVISPRASVGMGRRGRLQVTTPAIPTGGADDPNNVRIYMLPNASDPGAGAFKLQVTDALTARFLETYSSGGAADGGGTPFAAGTPAELKSALATGSGGWLLRGDGRFIPPSGTAFPSGPTTDQHFWRTDLGMLFFYNGTRWLSVQVFTQILRNTTASGDHAFSATTGSNAQSGPTPSLQGGSDIWIEAHRVGFFVNGGTALSGSHKWVGTVQKTAAAGGLTTFATTSIDSGASSQWREADTAVDALLRNGTGYFRWGTQWTKTGTPGDLSVHEELLYRIVAT